MTPLNFLVVAQAVATLSKDPSTKVGAIILDEDCNILSVGFNGFPRGVPDSPELYASKATKYSLIAHAEANAIAQAARTGARLMGSSLLVTELYPCTSCCKSIIQAGIRHVYAPEINTSSNPLWASERKISSDMFVFAGVTVHHYPSVVKLSHQNNKPMFAV